jgi:hypothetical protein
MFANGAGSSRAVLLCAVRAILQSDLRKAISVSAAIIPFGAPRQRLVKVNEP